MQSEGIFDPAVIEEFAQNPDNTYLVSFPRTGSHWLRALIELGLGKPTLTRVLYLIGRTDYVLLHDHDDDMVLRRRDVIYLYRDPVETVFSQMSYREDAIDDEAVFHCTEAYGRHLERWILQDTWTTRKTFVTYEGLQTDVLSEMTKVANHLGLPANPVKIARAARRATRQNIAERSAWNPKVIRLSPDYEILRRQFRERYSGLVWRTLLLGRDGLRPFFGR